MPDQTVVLERQQWQAMLQILCTTKEHPWVVTNPLIMALGQQLQPQDQALGLAPAMPTSFPEPPKGDGLDLDPPAAAQRRVPRN